MSTKKLRHEFGNIYSVPDVSAQAIMQTLEGISLAGEDGLSLEEISRYIGKTPDYARRCIKIALQFGAIRNVNGRYLIESEIGDILKVKMEDWPVLFRKLLQRYKPFTLFISLIDRGYSVDEACRKVRAVLNIAGSVPILCKSLTGWGKYAGILDIQRNGAVKLKVIEEKQPLPIKDLLESLNSELKIRLYVERNLSEQVFSYLQEDEVEFIVKAFEKIQEDPRNSIENMGRAFEDFLRRIAKDRKVDLSSAKGIGECAKIMHGSGDLMTERHLKICQYINTLRVIAAHSKERETLKPWKISALAAIAVLLASLSLMKSIYFYAFSNELIL